jgi:hypothetical protein
LLLEKRCAPRQFAVETLLLPGAGVVSQYFPLQLEAAVTDGEFRGFGGFGQFPGLFNHAFDSLLLLRFGQLPCMVFVEHGFVRR